MRVPIKGIAMFAAVLVLLGSKSTALNGHANDLNLMAWIGFAPSVANIQITASPQSLKRSHSSDMNRTNKELALRRFADFPNRSVTELRKEMIAEGIDLPSLSMLYRWKKKANVVRHLEKPTTSAFLLPDDAPGYVLTTKCGLRCKQSHRLNDGCRVYIVEDTVRGNKRTIQPSFFDFLEWLEKYVGKSIILYATDQNGIFQIN